MSTQTSTPHSPPRSPVWGGVLLSAITAVSWGFLAMAGVAALGLHLLGADAAGSLGPMTAAVVVMAVGGKVNPSGDVSVFGLGGAGAQAAIGVVPLGVGLVGALLVGGLFLRSLRGAAEMQRRVGAGREERGPGTRPQRSRGEARTKEGRGGGLWIGAGGIAVRGCAIAALFVALLGGLAWAGQDTIAIDAASLTGGAGKGGGGDGGGGLFGQLPGVGDLIDPKTSVAFHVDTPRSLLGGLVWVLGVLVIALLVSRRTPLPRRLEAAHRLVRPAASALFAMLLLAVAAGWAAAGFAALTDDNPGRIMGSALLGAPNGVWLGVPLGLFVRWRGSATGELLKVLPHPLDQLLTMRIGEPITPGRLAGLDRRVWLLTVAAALMMLTAGALAATRTPLWGASRAGYVGRCAVRLGAVTAAAFPLLVWLTGVKVDANLSVFGFNAVDAGLDLHGSLPWALLLGAAWGAGAGGLGALLALATGAAGRRVSPYALGRPATKSGTGTGVAGDSSRTYPGIAYQPGPYIPSPVYRPGQDEPNPYKEPPRQS